jgi:propanol-preferring alcohol dehydrogenase
MKAMVLEQLSKVTEGKKPLNYLDMPVPEPAEGEVLVRVSACGVCHTELDEIEGRTAPPTLPIIPGHQIIGRVESAGSAARRFRSGDRVGIAWIFSSCGKCKYCLNGDDNLCSDFKATGRDAHGGYAEYITIAEQYAFTIPDIFSDAEAAPLLCAGAIGYRSLRLSALQNGRTLGLTGFGASGHLVLKMAKHQYPDSDVFVFARSPEERGFAQELGAVWAGDTTDKAPVELDAIIDTTPVWKPFVEALGNLAPGGRLVINAIRKEEIDKEYLMSLDYPAHLWMEKEIKSVANVARRDVSEFLALAAEMNIKPEYQEYGLEKANQALIELKMRKIRGAKVLVV